MKRGRALLAALFALAAAAPCARGEEPDRSKAPAPGPPVALRLPEIQKKTLSNGIPVLFVEHRKVPLVEIHALLSAGASADPKGKPGLAYLTAAMLDRGAGGRSALQVADEIDYLGAELSARADWDATTVALNVPAERLDRALPILADVICRPAFPSDELERVRKDLLTEILQWRDEPRAIARLALSRALYGRHPYGAVLEGTEASVRGMSVADLKGFHASLYGPKNTTLIVVGDVTAAGMLPRLESAFGGWRASTASAPSVPPAPQVRRREVWLVDKPGAAQSEIRIGRVGPPRTTPDYFPLVVLNTVLGGSFTSRLNHNLREVHGYTYGAGSTFDFRLSTGPFFAAAAVQTDKTGPALSEFFKELEAIRAPVPAGELARAKSYVARRFPAGFETDGEVAGKLDAKVVFGLPDDYFDRYVEKIEAVTAADVRRAAAAAIDPEAVAVVVVGDRKKIEKDVAAVKLGPIRFLSIDDVLGAASPPRR